MKSMLLLTGLFFCLSAKSQTTTYKTNSWGDTKTTHDWSIALDHPIAEPVVIVQTPTVFKVTMGKKIKVYKIINSSDMDQDTKVFNTTMNTKPYIIKVMTLSPKTYAVFCENEWAVSDITDVVSTK